MLLDFIAVDPKIRFQNPENNPPFCIAEQREQTKQTTMKCLSATAPAALARFALLSLLAFSPDVLGSDSFRPVSVAAPPSRVRHEKQHWLHQISMRSANTRTTIFSSTPSAIGSLRGGGMVNEWIYDGDFAILGLTAVAASVVVPMTLYRQVYVFSVGYAFSIFAMGVAMMVIFGSDTLLAAASTSSHASKAPLCSVAALIFYGFRLGVFLLLREFTVESKHEQVKSFDTIPLLTRIPFAILLSVFYAFMVTPVLFLCRAENYGILAPATKTFGILGAKIAWTGLIIETVTDHQKFMAKRKGGKEDTLFCGPTTGWYSASRHPNFLGEVIFWAGILISGIPSFCGEYGREKYITAANTFALVCSIFGFIGISQIMVGATNRLETKQSKMYGGEKKYEEWKKNVPALIPNNPIRSILPIALSVGAALAGKKTLVFFLVD